MGWRLAGAKGAAGPSAAFGAKDCTKLRSGLQIERAVRTRPRQTEPTDDSFVGRSEKLQQFYADTLQGEPSFAKECGGDWRQARRVSFWGWGWLRRACRAGARGLA
jgi:hypothetical protein